MFIPTLIGVDSPEIPVSATNLKSTYLSIKVALGLGFSPQQPNNIWLVRSTLNLVAHLLRPFSRENAIYRQLISAQSTKHAQPGNDHFAYLEDHPSFLSTLW